MHPLQIAIDAAVAAGLDFFVLVGGDSDTRLKMGIPASFAVRQPLGLSFEAMYHRYSLPTADDIGLSCQLSFDSLYHCRIPWSCVQQFMINNPADGVWPKEWETGNEPAGTTDGTLPESIPEENDSTGTPTPKAPSAPNNVRQFRPRSKKG